MRIDAFIFDLDGTLADTLPVCFVAFRRTLEPLLNRRYTDEEIMAYFGPSEEGIFQRILPDQWEECLRTYLETYEQEHLRAARLFPGIEEALRRLRKRGIPLAIVTGKGPQSAAISFRHLGLARYFDVLETGGPEGSIKPQAIRKVLAGWGIPPKRVAYVGDAASDMEEARAAGLIPLGAAWEPRATVQRGNGQGPLVLFPTVLDFTDWIESAVESPASHEQQEEDLGSRQAEPSTQNPAD
jgi:HAD superfamily hydrolase (TIGR01549 family)